MKFDSVLFCIAQKRTKKVWAYENSAKIFILSLNFRNS